MTRNIPEKGAALQRDKETYAIAPHIPGGIIDPAGLRRIADVSEKYGARALKITSAQRIAIVGIKPEDIDKIWSELGMKPGGFTGPRIRYVKICPGITFCKRGQQDSIGVGLKIDEKYQGREMPSKLKIGVSGCTNSCAEPAVKDIGLIGTPRGWRLLAGGCAGASPRIGKVMAENLSDEDALAMVDRIIEYFRARGEKERLGEFIDKMGFDKFKENIIK